MPRLSHDARHARELVHCGLIALVLGGEVVAGRCSPGVSMISFIGSQLCIALCRVSQKTRPRRIAAGASARCVGMQRPNAARQEEEESLPLLEKDDDQAEESGEQHDWPKLGLAVLLGALCNLLSILDRNFWAASSNSMMQDIGIDNEQWGILNGSAFYFVYTGVAVILSPIADNVSRPRLMAFSVAVFSVVTALGGMARSAHRLEWSCPIRSQSIIDSHSRSSLCAL